jgi:hypothetical protein
VSVVVPDTWLSPFTTLPSLPGLSGQKGVEEPGKSKLMSQKGSMVVETPLQEKKINMRNDVCCGLRGSSYRANPLSCSALLF